MPTRGRPKGSGSAGKAKGKGKGKGEGGQTKGKSGVLFSAVEYCRWLEDEIGALRGVVGKVEEAAAAVAGP